MLAGLQLRTSRRGRRCNLGNIGLSVGGICFLPPGQLKKKVDHLPADQKEQFLKLNEAGDLLFYENFSCQENKNTKSIKPLMSGLSYNKL